MGNSVQILSNSITLIASSKTWIEGKAIEQLKKTAQLKGISHVVGMPDLHPGRGYPVGAAFLSKEIIYPALVGSDIGCGISFWQTDLKINKVKLDKFERKLHSLDDLLDSTWTNLIEEEKNKRKIITRDFDISFGTIGGGNHFAEFLKIESIIDNVLFNNLALDKSRLMFLVHSGSRSLGQYILVKHIEQFSHQGLKVNSEDFTNYIIEHNDALKWAELNRFLIAKRFLKAVNTNGTEILDINHNLISPCPQTSERSWIHRKGAIPSDQGYAIILGSRGDYSYLVRTKPTSKSLFSLAHGAGRKWMRTECKGRLRQKFKLDQFMRTQLGSRVICTDKNLLYEEAPEAYKKCDSIIYDLLEANLIDVVAKLAPVLTYKTRGGHL